jgi:hypothetical protein
MNGDRTAVTVGSRPVLVTADDLSGELALFHVSVGVATQGELSASDLEVTATAGGTALAMTEGPADGPLPSIGSRGITAFAQYTFANPGDAGPVVVTLAIGGESADFELSPPAVA